MKIRESGMPKRKMWGSFFNPAKILATLGLNIRTVDVAEFGCGYGTFTIPAAKIIKGKIYALDIEPGMIRMTDEEAKKQGLDNVRTICRDFMTEGSGLADTSVDYVMLFNILHLENPKFLLKEAWRILKKKGKLGMIHWNYDPKTPRGPSMDIRPKPQQRIRWAESVGFCNPVLHDLKPYHYGIIFKKGGCVMKMGIIISSNDTETCWNALRYGNFCLGQKDFVKVFFIGKGVEYQDISNEKFNTMEQAQKFLQGGGKIFACGTCIKSRQQEGSEMCPINTMKDLYEIVKESDKIVTF